MLEEDCRGPSLDNMLQSPGQVSQTGLLPFFIVAVHLWGDMTQLHISGGRRRYKHGPHDPEGEFYKKRLILSKFTAIMPSSLAWTVQNLRLHQVTGQAQAYINICFLVHHASCIMSQEYLPQLESQYSLASEVDIVSSFDAAGISFDLDETAMVKPCMFSVNTITEMAGILTDGGEQAKCFLQSSFAANAVLTATAVHLWVLYTQTCDACPKHQALAEAEKLRQVMKTWQSSWKVATAYVETLEMLYKLYIYSYGKIVDSELDCWDVGVDDINGIDNSLTDVGESEPYLSALSQRLYDKIRAILTNPLLPLDVKKKNLRTYSRTLWQHMWAMGPIEGFGHDLIDRDEGMIDSISVV